jgi:hypothetical protein
VPVTAQEIKDMTAEDYQELVSAPRAWPDIAAPRLNNFLAVIYSKAEQKVSEGVKKRGSAQKDLNLLNRYEGDFPPTLLKLMSGEGVAENAGFQRLALQIGVTANALGKKLDETLAACEGLCANHHSDSLRYNTLKKRRAEIARMYGYTCEKRLLFLQHRGDQKSGQPGGGYRRPGRRLRFRRGGDQQRHRRS